MENHAAIRKKELNAMLSLTLNQGNYLTIGDNIIVQLGRISGDRCKLIVHAPREVPVLRGEVLERTGGERPDCVLNADYWRKTEVPWNRSKEQALTAMRKLLSQMDGRDDGVKALRRQLNYMFPPEQVKADEQPTEVSNG